MKKIFSALVLCSLFSCTVQPTLPIFDLSDASKFGQSHIMPIDSLFSKIEEIRLETQNAPLIGPIYALYETSDAYYVCDGTLYVFAKDGKYIRQIGAIGRGPGEYLSMSKCVVDEKSGDLLAFDYYGQNLLRYSTEWRPIDAFSTLTQDSLFYVKSFFMDHNIPIFYRDNNSLQMDLLAFDWNAKTTTPISKSEREMLAGEGILESVFSFGFPERPYVFSYFSETVFLLENQHLTPVFTIPVGRYKCTFEELATLQISGPKTQISGIVQGGDYAFVLFHGANVSGGRAIPCLGLYNMRSGASYPQIKIQDAQYAYHSLSGDSELFQGFDPQTLLTVQYPENMRESGVQISENDNPVIIKYWFK